MFYSILHRQVCILIVGKGNAILVTLLHIWQLKMRLLIAYNFVSCYLFGEKHSAHRKGQTDLHLKLYQKASFISSKNTC